MATPASAVFPIMQHFAMGVEVQGDLGQPMTAAAQARLRALLDEHGLLVLRRQNLTLDQQIAAIGQLGPVLRTIDGVGYISTDPAKGGLGTGELAFHSDLAFTPHPFNIISLHATEVEDGKTSTRFCSGTQAYRRLPAPLQARLAQLRVISAMPSDQASNRLDEVLPTSLPNHTHPALSIHPRSGMPILYVSEQQAVCFEGMARAESRALLTELFGYLYAPAHVYEHHWHQGDIVIWDNLAAQHARGRLDGLGIRTLQRVVSAEHSFYKLCPQFNPEDPEYLKWLNAADARQSGVSLAALADQSTAT